MRWHGRKSGKEIMKWLLGKGGRVVSREGRMGFKNKIVCIAPWKQNVGSDSLKEFDNSYLMF